MSKTLLVTGGAGFIGSAFIRQMVEKGNQVIVLDCLTYAGQKSNLETSSGPIHGKGTIELVVASINDHEKIRKLLRTHQADAIVHFAAESHVDRSITGPGVFLETNVSGTYVLLQAALEYWQTLTGEKKNGFRYLQVSTDEVYGALGPEGKFSEATPYAPNSPYSASKAAADLFVRAWFHTYGLPTITTNCSNNYGPRQYPEKLIPVMIMNAITGKPLPVYGKGENIRDWIHVEDHSHGVYLALTQGRPGETYCFGGDAERRNLDLVHTLCDGLDALHPRIDGKSHRTAIQYVTDRLGHDFRYAIDDTKAQKELGFTRRYTFEQGIRDTVVWYLDHLDWAMTIYERKAGEANEGNTFSRRQWLETLSAHSKRI